MHYHPAKACDDIEPIYFVCLELSEVGVSVMFLVKIFGIQTPYKGEYVSGPLKLKQHIHEVWII